MTRSRPAHGMIRKWVLVHRRMFECGPPYIQQSGQPDIYRKWGTLYDLRIDSRIDAAFARRVKKVTQSRVKVDWRKTWGHPRLWM